MPWRLARDHINPAKLPPRVMLTGLRAGDIVILYNEPAMPVHVVISQELGEGNFLGSVIDKARRRKSKKPEVVRFTAEQVFHYSKSFRSVSNTEEAMNEINTDMRTASHRGMASLDELLALYGSTEKAI